MMVIGDGDWGWWLRMVVEDDGWGWWLRMVVEDDGWGGDWGWWLRMMVRMMVEDGGWGWWLLYSGSVYKTPAARQCCYPLPTLATYWSFKSECKTEQHKCHGCRE
jgi:hypothetical protein